MRDRRAVLVADPERAVGEADDPFGIEAVEVARQRLAGAVHGVLGRRRLQRVEHAGERVAVAVLEGDDVGDAEGAVVEQHHAIDRRAVGRRRIDAAVLHALAGREVHADDFLHLAAGDVGTAVADRPDHVRRVLRAAPGAAADTDREVEGLAAFEGERADAQQRVVAGVELGLDVLRGRRAGDQRSKNECGQAARAQRQHRYLVGLNGAGTIGGRG